MNFKSLADKAKQAIDQRGGTERLKQDAERLRNIATGPGTPQEKAKRAREALRDQPQAGSQDPFRPTGETFPPR